MIQRILRRRHNVSVGRWPGGTKAYLACGHHKFMNRPDLDEWDCEMCDTSVLYHGTSGESLLSILQDGYMYEDTPATEAEYWALDHARTNGDDENDIGVVLTLDIKKAQLRPVPTGFWESKSTVPLDAILAVKFYRRHNYTPRWDMEFLVEADNLDAAKTLLLEFRRGERL